MRQQCRDDLFAGRVLSLAQGAGECHQDPADGFLRHRRSAAPVHQHEIEVIGVGDTHRRATVAADGDTGHPQGFVPQRHGRATGAHRAHRFQHPTQCEGVAGLEWMQQHPGGHVTVDALAVAGSFAAQIAHALGGCGKHFAAECVAQFLDVIRGECCHPRDNQGAVIRQLDTELIPVLLCRDLERIAPVEVGMELNRIGHGIAC
jgi:hypothetical protein